MLGSVIVVSTLLLLCLSFGPAMAQDWGPRPEARGTWILERPPLNSAQIEETFRRLNENGFNLVYVRTWYRGHTIYPSDVVEAAGGPRQDPAFAGRDPIAEAIELGKRYDIQIAFWMEYGLMSYAQAGDTSDPGPILTANPEWSMSDRNGRNFHAAHNLHFFWMDPSNPDVREFLVGMARELAERYPEAAMYESDRFRYPDVNWGYNPSSRGRYMAETGNLDPITITSGHAQWTAWRDWRRRQTTKLMGEVYAAVKETNPAMVVSGAVVPPYMIGGSQEKLQFWPAWVDSGFVDVLEPMLYLPDASYRVQLTSAKNLLPASKRDFVLYPGIEGTRGAEDAFDLLAQIEESRRQGVDGVTLWYEGGLSATDLQRLRTGPFAVPTTLPHDDRIVDNRETARFSIDGAGETLSEGFRGTSVRLAAGSGSTASWQFRLLRSGHYDLRAAWTPSVQNSREVVFTLYVNGEVHGSYSVNQQSGGLWQRLGSVYLDYDDDAVLVISSSEDGDAIADAARLQRIAPFGIESAHAIEEIEVQLRFNHRVDVGALNAASFSVESVGVTGVRPVHGDPYVLVLETSSLQTGIQYDVTVEGLVDVEGRELIGRTAAFEYDPEATGRTLDNHAATGFSTVPDWKMQATWSQQTESENYSGDFYLSTTGGQRNVSARWISTMPREGRFEIRVKVPSGIEGRSDRAGYIIGHKAGFDSVYVSHRRPSGGWVSLGVFEYASGGSALVMLQSDISTGGNIVANAVNWRLTLATVDAEEAFVPYAYEIGPAYPNPFAANVTVPVSSKSPCLVRWAVYDVLGRLVLGEDVVVLLAGRSEIRLDLPRDLARGLYFIRMNIHAGGRPNTPIHSKIIPIVRN